jgi:hypothetical protein
MPAMPFGKFRGRDLRDVPDSYLEWLIDNLNLDGWLLTAVRRELQSRDDDEPSRGYRHQETRHPPPPDPADLRAVVGRWHRQLSMAYHPDRGGSNEMMRVVNAGKDLILELLAEEGLLN